MSWARSHRIEPLTRRELGRFELSYAPLRQSSAGSLACNGGFRDRIGPTDSAFCLLIVFDGTGEHAVGGRRFPLTRASAAMHSAGQAVDVTTSGHSEMLSLSIGREAIAGEMANHLGRPIQAPVEFAPSLNMESAAGVELEQLAVRLCEELDRVRDPRHASLGVAQLERWLVSHLVDSQRHNYTRLLHRASAGAPWQVRAAEEFIHANAARPLSLGDIAATAGVSVRTLQYSFGRHRGMRPMDFLRQVRLQHAREDLLSAEKIITVSEAAARWGFSHFGRFAAEYKERYGESPSATLRRTHPEGKRSSRTPG